MPNVMNAAYVAVILHHRMPPQLALIRDSEGESMKQAKKKRIKQLVLTGLGLVFIVALILLTFVATQPTIAGGG